MVKGEKRDITRAAQDAYFYIICKGLIKVFYSISETVAHSFDPVAMGEWRFRASDQEHSAYFCTIGHRHVGVVRRRFKDCITLLIGWSSGKPLADDLRGQ